VIIHDVLKLNRRNPMSTEKIKIKDMSIWEDARQMLRKAEQDGVETAWDRLAKQTPHCRFGETGVCCRICTMGPCRISKSGGIPVYHANSGSGWQLLPYQDGHNS
jgi:carbon-monoxide dehydrogenase catalytic subunit